MTHHFAKAFKRYALGQKHCGECVTAVWNVTFCSVTIPAFSISLPIYVLQVALDGIGNTKSFLVTPRYFPMISLGISKRRTLEATSDFFLRLIILGVRQRKTGYCSISVF